MPIAKITCNNPLCENVFEAEYKTRPPRYCKQDCYNENRARVQREKRIQSKVDQGIRPSKSKEMKTLKTSIKFVHVQLIGFLNDLSINKRGMDRLACRWYQNELNNFVSRLEKQAKSKTPVTQERNLFNYAECD